MGKPKAGIDRFVLDGKPMQKVPTPKMVVAMIAYLESLPFGQLKRRVEIAEVIGVTKASMDCHLTHKELAENRHSLRYHDLVWGSKETIAELKKELETNAN